MVFENLSSITAPFLDDGKVFSRGTLDRLTDCIPLGREKNKFRRFPLFFRIEKKKKRDIGAGNINQTRPGDTHTRRWTDQETKFFFRGETKQGRGMRNRRRRPLFPLFNRPSPPYQRGRPSPPPPLSKVASAWFWVLNLISRPPFSKTRCCSL